MNKHGLVVISDVILILSIYCACVNVYRDDLVTSFFGGKKSAPRCSGSKKKQQQQRQKTVNNSRLPQKLRAINGKDKQTNQMGANGLFCKEKDTM